jgi:hypothetical protein
MDQQAAERKAKLLARRAKILRRAMRRDVKVFRAIILGKKCGRPAADQAKSKLLDF